MDGGVNRRQSNSLHNFYYAEVEQRNLEARTRQNNFSPIMGLCEDSVGCSSKSFLNLRILSDVHELFLLRACITLITSYFRACGRIVGYTHFQLFQNLVVCISSYFKHFHATSRGKKKGSLDSSKSTFQTLSMILFTEKVMSDAPL